MVKVYSESAPPVNTLMIHFKTERCGKVSTQRALYTFDRFGFTAVYKD